MSRNDLEDLMLSIVDRISPIHVYAINYSVLADEFHVDTVDVEMPRQFHLQPKYFSVHDMWKVHVFAPDAGRALYHGIQMIERARSREEATR